ncbi:MAG: cupin domain-containing protein [Chloroflexota bacterium]
MAKILSLTDGKRFQMGGGDSRHLISPEMGATCITLNYSVFEPDHEFPQHFHDFSADIFVVLEGGVSVRQGETYTPITEGDFAYIPPGEVHGTVNTSGAQAILISFQAPPDMTLYRGERDPAVTGVTPTPPENHTTTVQIRQLNTGQTSAENGIQMWQSASPETGTKEMKLTYYELEPDNTISEPAITQGEVVWFIWQGEVAYSFQGEQDLVPERGAAFVTPGEPQTLTNTGRTLAKLIRCQSLA